MKKYIKKSILVCLLAAAAALTASSAYAEGSKELTQYGGNRPFLEWQSTKQMEQPRQAVIYAYVEAEETVNFGSSVPYVFNQSINSVCDGLSGKIDELRDDWKLSETLYPSIAVTMPSENGGTAFDPQSAAEDINVKYNTENPIAEDAANTVYLYGYTPRENKHYSKNKGFIYTIDEEKNGDYIPATFTAPVTGTYAFRFLSTSHSSLTPHLAGTDESLWNDDTGEDINKQGNSNVAAWDIAVKDGNNTVQNGRVWTDMLFMNMGGNSKDSNGGWHDGLKSNVYILTDDGFEYQVDFNGIDPFGFAFYSNRRGLLLDGYNKYTNSKDTSEVRPLLHSVYSSDETSGNDVGKLPIKTEFDDYGAKNGISSVLANLVPVDKEKDSTHKIFFNKPSDDAVAAYTKESKLIENISDIKHPEKDGFDFSFIGAGTGAENETEVSYGTKGAGGQFEVVIPESAFTEGKLNVSSFRVALDFSSYKLADGKPVTDADGKWITGTKTAEEQNNIVIIANSITDENGKPTGEETTDSNNNAAYKYTFSWDGRDAYGNIVPVGEYDGAVKASWEIGAAHFPLLDVEGMSNGIKIKRLNLTGADNADTVYYNNECSSSDGSLTAWYFRRNENSVQFPSQIGDGVNAINGVSSNFDDEKSDGAMAFDVPSGDRTVLDLWTRYTLDTNKSIAIGINEPMNENKVVSGPYVSFVAENGRTDIEGVFEKSHVKYIKSLDNSDKEEIPINDYDETGNMGSENVYGNTISTGFTAKYQRIKTTSEEYLPPSDSDLLEIEENTGVYEEEDLPSSDLDLSEDGENTGVYTEDDILPSDSDLFEDEENTEVYTEDDLAENEENTEVYSEDDLTLFNSVTDSDDDNSEINSENITFYWTVTVPVDGTYIKVSNDASPALSYKNEPILKDTNAAVNNGAIYETNGNGGTLKFKYDTGITYTGEGTSTISIITGIVLDDLYAPNATAKFDIKADSSDDYVSISGIEVKAASISEYENSGDNKYKKRGDEQ